jgi:formate hydrogenlyase subunit 7
MSGFKRSLAFRHLVCGSCNGCEHEVNALEGPDYDLTSLGYEIAASPRHADAITVTGPMTEAMREPARETIDAAPRPRVIVAIGDCAIGTAVWCDNGSGAGSELGASVSVAGCPPAPRAILAGLAQAAALLDGER